MFLLSHLLVHERLFSNLGIVFCVFPAENNFVKALIPFIGVTSLSFLTMVTFFRVNSVPDEDQRSDRQALRVPPTVVTNYR